METVTITLTQEQFRNLGVFIGRSNMSAQEVPAFLDLNQALQAAVAPKAPLAKPVAMPTPSVEAPSEPNT